MKKSPLAGRSLDLFITTYTYIRTSHGYLQRPAWGAIVITLVTVSYQSIKATLANPVKSLRRE